MPKLYSGFSSGKWKNSSLSNCWPDVIVWSCVLPNEFVVITLGVLNVYCFHLRWPWFGTYHEYIILSHAGDNFGRIMSPLLLPLPPSIRGIYLWINHGHIGDEFTRTAIRSWIQQISYQHFLKYLAWISEYIFTFVLRDVITRPSFNFNGALTESSTNVRHGLAFCVLVSGGRNYPMSNYSPSVPVTAR